MAIYLASACAAGAACAIHVRGARMQQAAAARVFFDTRGAFGQMGRATICDWSRRAREGRMPFLRVRGCAEGWAAWLPGEIRTLEREPKEIMHVHTHI